MSEGYNMENGQADSRFLRENLSGWNPGYPLEPPISTTVQANLNCQVTGHEATTTSQATVLGEERCFGQPLEPNWCYPSDQHQQQTWAPGCVTSSVVSREEDTRLNNYPPQWINNDAYETGGSTLRNSVDNFHEARNNYAVVNPFVNYDQAAFSAQDIPAYPPCAQGNFGYPHSLATNHSHYLSVPIPAGYIHVDNDQNLAPNRPAGLAELTGAAVDGGTWPSSPSIEELNRDFQRLSYQIEQPSLALPTSAAFSPSQYPPRSYGAFSSHNPSINHFTPQPATGLPEDQTFVTSVLLPTSVPSRLDSLLPSSLPPRVDSLLVTSVLPRVDPGNIPSNFGTINGFLPDPRSTPMVESNSVELPLRLDASFEGHWPHSPLAPDNARQSPPEYPSYPINYSAVNCDSYESLLKPLSLSASSREMNHPILDTSQSPSTNVPACTPSTSGGRGSKKRSSLSSQIILPSTIKEFNYGDTALITKGSRGRRPITRPNTEDSSDDMSIIKPVLAPNAQFFGSHWDVRVEPELLHSMETEKTRKVKKAFVCKIDRCTTCFRRSEHLRRHVQTRHSDEKPFGCSWPGCNQMFNRNDNMRQHLRTHYRRQSSNR
ncbi:zf-C2H2 Zinc finger, C2H2 type [Puccinia graminis f. sp. tritici]|uniref:Zinc finger protein MSN2/4 n=2 Tax=Puccinia graminis f. sp. tritici TaxID=56615 RepID=E3KH92_PUCGT|nr:zinc finger protein MSN2/4 [Puccinia graminis f. sp. tritici CRL 75-36-700-3]EFP83667.2 zinc finger protein MSN2/4 [Puccinia graminis f. sp. tritici CRL 75-36-700-3]KAA1066385.1 zf-C2H2 Zinc finger, C2H2 type [Puccinia graminis f. sp. tritici]KAA1082007.1 zf-C2H2 Zinc finger, C2H2 type [Puccinia graminis f. sp. tritici]